MPESLKFPKKDWGALLDNLSNSTYFEHDQIAFIQFKMIICVMLTGLRLLILFQTNFALLQIILLMLYYG
ncbi:unnamed protein product [Blepharisma stoltei]|uniref:Uncharacterized protein n=1 Tax=Blepharisma stoltei TaxID=1481888 RepID=A0AAU9IJM6_9CILI|nr:unnamed protein product [Blepharisma stoltei]